LTPGCSTCGYAVELLRSCYESSWHLFRDSPATTTRGRYFVVPDSTPVYPGFHLLGSRNWLSDNYRIEQTLGEDLDTPQVWFPGTAPVQYPLPQVVGTASCVEIGDTLSDAVSGESLVAGFPPSCFQASPLDPLFITYSDIWRCRTQLYYAQIIEALYAGSIAVATQMIYGAFGPGVVVRWHPGGGAYPGVLTVAGPGWFIAAGHGTTNFQQIALYSFYGVAPPSDVGIFSTNFQFYDAADYLHGILVADGMTPNMPLMLAGHSYGGAMVQLLAARYRVAFPNRIIRFLTYGAPKSGDPRFKSILERIDGLALENDQDFVPLLPPDLSALEPVIRITGLGGLTVWVPWQRPPTTLLQYDDGTVAADTPGTMSTGTLLTMVLQVIAHQTVFGMPAHPINQYIQRIALRCQNEPEPAAGNVILGALYNFSPVELGLERLGGGPAGGRLAIHPGPALRGALELTEPPQAEGALELLSEAVAGGAVVHVRPQVQAGQLAIAGITVSDGRVVVNGVTLVDGALELAPPP
jgi:pimeloyl-ACP methyl ester carboxylesterase